MRIPQVTDRINTDRIKEAPAQALRAVFAGVGQLLVVAERIKKQASERVEARERGKGSERDEARERDETGKREAGRPADGPDRGIVSRSSPAQASPAKASPAKASPAQASPVRARRSLDQTGNVRLLSAEDLADDLPASPASSPPAEPPTDATPANATPADAIAAEAAPADGSDATDIADTSSAEMAPADAGPAGTPLAGRSAAASAVSADALPVPNYDSLTLPSLRARLRMLDAHQLRVLIEYERSQAARADVVAMFERRIAKLAAEG